MNMVDALDFSNKKVAILGDAMIDKYTFGTVARVSQEAPVPIVQVESGDIRGGGALHTALAVAGLGATAHFISATGSCEDAQEFGRILDRYPSVVNRISNHDDVETLVRHRIMSSETVMLRIDSGGRINPNDEATGCIVQNLEEIWHTCDALIISDYNYGVITDQVVKAIKRLLKQRKIFLAADSRNVERFKELRPDLVKPNESEAFKLLGLPYTPNKVKNMDVLDKHSNRLLSLTGSNIVATTVGHRGVLLMQKTRKSVYAAPPFISDMQESGAGDSFIAAATLAMVSGMAVHDVAQFANSAAALSIEKGSTGVCTMQDIRNTGVSSKVNTPANLLALLEKAREQGKKIVFTNGCFDLLHKGHVDFLNQSKAQGDILVVGVNTDESVRRLKGDERPINNLENRCAVLSGLESVDYLVAFDEDTPEELISVIHPDIFAKAGYALEQLPEANTVRRYGGEIRLFKTIPGSTTEIIARIRGATK